MPMTLRLPPDLDAEVRTAAKEDHRSVHQTIVLAVETFLAMRETAEVKADPDTLRALARAREEIARGEVYTTDDIVAALDRRRTRSA